jgi:hypothetical protein
MSATKPARKLGSEIYGRYRPKRGLSVMGLHRLPFFFCALSAGAGVHSKCFQSGLRFRTPLLSRLAIPLHRFSIILSDASAVVVHPTKIVLRLRIQKTQKYIEGSPDAMKGVVG